MSAFQGSALSGWAAVYEARPRMPHSRGLAVNLIDLWRLIQKNMNLVGNAFSIRSDLLFVLPARGTLSFVMENFEHPWNGAKHSRAFLGQGGRK